jgi:recombination associated protein RdgC
MSFLSSTVSVTRYKVVGKLEEPIMESITEGLKNHVIPEIEDETSDMVVGWTSFETPFIPNFEGSSFVIGPYFLFSLRIDKKSIPPKIIKKHYTISIAKHLKETNKEYLSRSEKKELKEHVINVLNQRIPSTPNVFDLLWNYEESVLWFFSTQNAANEELESFFIKSFKINLIRLFPYTLADQMGYLNDSERDAFSKLSHTSFME